MLSGFVDVPYVEDVDFCWRAQRAGFELRAAPGAVVHYGLRSTLPAIVTQGWRYGRAQPLLHRTYKAQGMPRRSVGEAVRTWWSVIKRLVRARTRSAFAADLFTLAVYTGRIAGSVSYRNLFV